MKQLEICLPAGWLKFLKIKPQEVECFTRLAFFSYTVTEHNREGGGHLSTMKWYDVYWSFINVVVPTLQVVCN